MPNNNPVSRHDPCLINGFCHRYGTHLATYLCAELIPAPICQSGPVVPSRVPRGRIPIFGSLESCLFGLRAFHYFDLFHLLLPASPDQDAQRNNSIATREKISRRWSIQPFPSSAFFSAPIDFSAQQCKINRKLDEFVEATEKGTVIKKNREMSVWSFK